MDFTKHIKNCIRCGKDLPSSIWISCKVRPRSGQNRYTVRGGGTEAAEKSTVYLIGILILALKMALYQFFKFKSL